MNKPFLTVFTPAYNRDYSLPRTYEYMRMQKNTDFIWLIVDDGSSDNTAELVKKWQAEDNGFEIRYVYKENGGMHTGHNVAYELCDTELNVCIDSDDALSPNAVQIIYDAWQKVKDQGYAGLLGLDAEFNGNVLGPRFPDELTETTVNGYYENGGWGDRKIVLRTDVVRKYPPYPTFPGEKFVPLGSLYAMIDRDYKLRTVNEVLCLVEYMPDGSTQNMIRQYYRNPNGFRYGRLVSLTVPRKLKRKLIIYIHYAAESILAGKPILKDAPSKALALLTMPAGWLLSLHIRRRNK